MTELKHLLAKFNRKERYWLLRDAIGEPFHLSKQFCGKLTEALKMTIPCGAWWAMDYHIDWLVAVLRTYPDRVELAKHYLNDQSIREIRGNQEDFDLVVAFDRNLILVEAKTGNFIDQQLESKLSRLGNLKWADGEPLIGPDGTTRNDIHISFVLCSPKKNLINLKFHVEPSTHWSLKQIKPIDLYHITLPFPKKTFMVSRCEETTRKTWKKSSEGQHWAIYPVETHTEF
jgi:hypothetical protein